MQCFPDHLLKILKFKNCKKYIEPLVKLSKVTGKHEFHVNNYAAVDVLSYIKLNSSLKPEKKMLSEWVYGSYLYEDKNGKEGFLKNFNSIGNS